MADRSGDKPAAGGYSDRDMANARKWFAKANDSRQKREYDYAIESYLSGLALWPDAVEEALMPLRSLWTQRHQSGGKKPGMMDGMKRSMSSKDLKQNFLNALWLLARDPEKAEYAEGVLKNASKAGYLEATRFIAPLYYDLLKKDKKPDLGKFRGMRQCLIEAADKAAETGSAPLQVTFLELAVASLDYLRARLPDADDLRNEQRDLSSKLTITRGKYQDAESFRDSIQGAEQQKLLHDADRGKQGDQTVDALIVAARKEVAENAGNVLKVNALVDALLRRERQDEEDEAIGVLLKHHADSKNYNYKLKADDIRLKQLTRQARALVEQARKTGDEDDKRNARLSAMELAETELDVYRERCDNYPTDLRLKYKLGSALFKAGKYDEAIPVLQHAQTDPRNRTRCELMIGRCFFEQNQAAQARDVLREALDHYDIADDLQKEIMYYLGRAYEAEGNRAEALSVFGRLLRQDYNYANGDARRRLDALKQASTS